MARRESTGEVIAHQRKSGIYYAIRLRVPDGIGGVARRGMSVGRVTKREADEALKDALAAVRMGARPPGMDGPDAAAPAAIPCFEEFAAEWLESRMVEGGRDGKGLTEAGRVDLEWQIRCHLVPAFGTTRVDAITTAAINQYRQSKARCAQAEPKGINPTSINKTLSTLLAILTLAEEHDLIPRMPKVKKLKAVRPNRTYLDNADHIEALLQAAASMDGDGRTAAFRRPLLATLVFAGPRIGEALELRWADVDLANGALRIRGTKTEAAMRRVKLVPVLREILAEWKAAQAAPQPEGRVFPTATGKRQNPSNVRCRVLAPAVERANVALGLAGLPALPVGLTPHSLRRTFASLLVATNEPMTYTKSAMGHTSAALTLSVYAAAMEWEDTHAPSLVALLEGDRTASVTALSGTHRARETFEGGHALAA